MIRQPDQITQKRPYLHVGALCVPFTCVVLRHQSGGWRGTGARLFRSGRQLAHSLCAPLLCVQRLQGIDREAC
jgi:hypothetical protein